MKPPTRTKLFVFCVAIAIEILVAVMWHRHIRGIYYLPFFTPFLSGALLCSLLRSNLIKSTVLLGIMISVVGGCVDWVTWRLGIQQDIPGVWGALSSVFFRLFIIIPICGLGGYSAVMIHKLWQGWCSRSS